MLYFSSLLTLTQPLLNFRNFVANFALSQLRAFWGALLAEIRWRWAQKHPSLSLVDFEVIMTMMINIIILMMIITIVVIIMITFGNCKCCYLDKSGSTSRTRTSPFVQSPPCPPRCCCHLISRLKSAVNSSSQASVFETLDKQHQNKRTAIISFHTFFLFDLDFDQFLQYS